MINEKIVITLFLITSFLHSQAQHKKIDSLSKLLGVSKQDTSRVILIYQLSGAYVRSKPDSAILFAQQALQLARDLHFSHGEQRAEMAVGNAFTQMGNYPKALVAYLNALKIAELMHDDVRMAGVLLNIANLYSYEGDERQSINFTLRALTAAKTARDKRRIAVSLSNLGDSYEKLNVLDTALAYTMQGYGVSKKLDNKNLLGILSNNLGNIYRKLRKPDSALYYYRRAITIYKQTDVDDSYAESTIGMAKVFKSLHIKDSSLYYARQSIMLGQRGGFTERVLDASNFLTDYFKNEGRLDSAFRYQQVLLAAKDSLFSQEKTKEVQDLMFSERQRQQEIREREASYQANIRFYLLVALVLFLIVLAFVFWRNNRRNEKAKKLLQKQKERIQDTLGELKITQDQLIQSAKMASLGELTAGIAHEIQNPLNFVNNFSDVNREMVAELKEALQTGDITEAVAIANDIEQNEEKISHHGKRAESVVKGMLEHSRSGSGERQSTDINTLADEFLKLAYHGYRAKNKTLNAELVTNFDPLLPNIKVMQQDIGRVLVNIFSNAFYSIAQKATTSGIADFKPRVDLTTSVQNGDVVIKIKDNGNGIAEEVKNKIMQPFFTTKPAGEGTGLGLSLSYDIIVKGHGGTLEVNSEVGEHCEFTIKLLDKDKI